MSLSHVIEAVIVLICAYDLITLAVTNPVTKREWKLVALSIAIVILLLIVYSTLK